MARHGAGVERGGHDEDAQVGAEVALDVEGEREAEVRVDAALVEFVEDEQPGVGEFRIGGDAAGEEAFGEDDDPRIAAEAAFEAHVVADGGAGRFAEEVGHAPGGGSGGHAARFEHEDALAGEPVFAEEGEGDDGRLAGARWRGQDGGAVVAQGRAQTRQGGGDGEVGELRIGWHARGMIANRYRRSQTGPYCRQQFAIWPCERPVRQHGDEFSAKKRPPPRRLPALLALEASP